MIEFFLQNEARDFHLQPNQGIELQAGLFAFALANRASLESSLPGRYPGLNFVELGTQRAEEIDPAYVERIESLTVVMSGLSRLLRDPGTVVGIGRTDGLTVQRPGCRIEDFYANLGSDIIPNRDLLKKDQYLSRNHVEITYAAQHGGESLITVTDLGSTNGTFVSELKHKS